jgi:hypothetical protein
MQTHVFGAVRVFLFVVSVAYLLNDLMNSFGMILYLIWLWMPPNFVAYLLNDLMNSFADDIVFDLVMDADFCGC